MGRWHQGEQKLERSTLEPNSTNGQADNNSTTNLPHRNAIAQHLDMSWCWDVANFCPLVAFVAGVRSRCPCSGVWLSGDSDELKCTGALRSWQYSVAIRFGRFHENTSLICTTTWSRRSRELTAGQNQFICASSANRCGCRLLFSISGMRSIQYGEETGSVQRQISMGPRIC